MFLSRALGKPASAEGQPSLKELKVKYSKNGRKRTYNSASQHTRLLYIWFLFHSGLLGISVVPIQTSRLLFIVSSQQLSS